MLDLGFRQDGFIMDCVPPISAAEDERGFMQDAIHRKCVLAPPRTTPANADRHHEHSCDSTVRGHSQPLAGLLRRMVWSADNNPVGCII